MKVLSMRFCTVSSSAEPLRHFFQALGLPSKSSQDPTASDGIFLAGQSWIEVWPESDGMPAGTMLQLIVDDADAFAEQARSQGLSPQGPMEAHGEKIYFLEAPNGMPVSFQSALSETSTS